MRWEYRDAAGRLLGFKCRFDLKGGAKDFRPLVFAEHKKFGRQWRWLGFARPRPLYGLDRLAKRPKAPVIIAEGEKAANAVGALLPDHVAITSPDGSKNARVADWAPLAGRKVTIWPDADAPGQAYVGDVIDMLMKLSPVATVAVVKPPEGVAEGWDAADALATGWITAQAAELVAAAAPASDEGAAASRRRKPATRDWLLDLIGDAELWHDPEHVAFATVPVDDHRENCELGSDSFKNWLSWRAYEAVGHAPPADAADHGLLLPRVREVSMIAPSALVPLLAELALRTWPLLGCTFCAGVVG